MTDLEKAIAEIQRAKVEDTYTLETAEAWKEISEAVASGALIPATERDAAVAAALEAVVKKSIRPHSDTARKKLKEAHDKNDYHGATLWSSVVAHLDIVDDAILALIPQPQADALARVRAAAVKIKPLVWFEVEKSRYGGKYTADGYTIRYIEGLWLLDFAGQSKAIWRFSSLDEAKAAAQADHNARIRAAIGGAE